MNEKKPVTSHYMKNKRYNDRINLKTGTFLHTYCPKCGAGLIEDNEIRLIAVSRTGEEGSLELSPYLNVFEHRTSMDVQPREELAEIRCPHCRASIVHPEVKCGYCESHTAELSVAAVHLRVPFLICMKEGCRWHGITPEDEQTLIRDSCDEW